MPVTAGDAFTLISGHIPQGVLHPAFNTAMDRITTFFDSCGSSYYLEWHFNERRQCDLLCSLLFENGSRLHRRLLEANCSPADKRWDALCRFLASWSSINAATGNSIPHLWLACDFDKQSTRFSPPNIHFCLDRQFTARDRRPGYRNELTQQQFDSAFKAIMEGTGFKFRKPVIAFFRKCFRALQPHGEILHLSFMHLRRPPLFKLNCTIPRESIAEILSALGWRGGLSLIAALCEEAAPSEKRIKCNIGFTEKRCNRFEIELEYNTPPETDPRRKPLLAALFRRGLVTKRQMRDLLKWPGNSVAPAGIGMDSVSIRRWLDIKICFDEEGALTAKAYLGFAPLLQSIRW